MNRYESIILDKMVEIRRKWRAVAEPGPKGDLEYTLGTLLDCIIEFREPPRALDVGEGYGALCAVDMDGEVAS